MPRKCAMAAQNASPHLEVGGVPAGAKYLVLIMDDPDAPAGLWTHWLLWNIWPSQGKASFGGTVLVKGATVGRNSFGNVRYDGPAPPSGTHRYFFHVYAVDKGLSLPNGASRDELESAMKGHLMGSAEFFGTYSANP